MKKGFTLIELICVITILGLIALIAVPTVNTMIQNSKEKAYEEQITTIEKTTKTYMTNNSLFLPKTGSCYVEISTLKKNGFLTKDDILNPNNNEVIDGVVVVTVDEVTVNAKENKKKYTYEYSSSKTGTECRKD